VIGLAVAAPSASAGLVFEVNTTGDGPDAAPGDHICDTQPAVAGDQCSLRAAIREADTEAGSDSIVFNIPGSGVKTIDPHSELPHITGPVLINGYTQGAATPNTESLGQGDNANLLVELSGANTADTFGINGLTVDPGGVGTLIEGLVINRFSGTGLILKDDATVQGNFIGTGPGGNAAHGVGFDAIFNDAHAQVGGVAPSARNLISGNGRDGVNGNGTFTVQGNYIGTQRDGESPLPNADSGIRLFTSGSTIGGASAGNVIAFNGSDAIPDADGITIFNTSQGNSISRNRIFSNRDLGIDLNNDGVTPNDLGDGDTGPNELQNFPVITSATRGGAGALTIDGRLRSTPSRTFTLEFFKNPPGGDEGATLIGTTMVSTDGVTGLATFTFHPPKSAALGDRITTTATNANDSTSEFSAPRKVVSP
jgi:CSLREA domain-containing protein